jgi:hypothetical protein
MHSSYSFELIISEEFKTAPVLAAFCPNEEMKILSGKL